MDLGDTGLALPLVLLVVIAGAQLSTMREACAGLAEKMLADSGGDQLRQAEGHFRALVATARELKEFELRGCFKTLPAMA